MCELICPQWSLSAVRWVCMCILRVPIKLLRLCNSHSSCYSQTWRSCVLYLEWTKTDRLRIEWSGPVQNRFAFICSQTICDFIYQRLTNAGMTALFPVIKVMALLCGICGPWSCMRLRGNTEDKFREGGSGVLLVPYGDRLQSKTDHLTLVFSLSPTIGATAEHGFGFTPRVIPCWIHVVLSRELI